MDGQMIFGGLQVLTNGHHVNTALLQIGQNSPNFLGGFAQADHEAGFGPQPRFFDAGQLLQTAFVAGLGPHGAVKSGDGFHVMRNHFGLGVHDDFQGFPMRFDVRYQGFHGGPRRYATNFADRCSPNPRPTIRQFIPVHRG